MAKKQVSRLDETTILRARGGRIPTVFRLSRGGRGAVFDFPPGFGFSPEPQPTPTKALTDYP